MATNYEHAWQLDVEFGKLDPTYAQQLCDALVLQYGMSVGIFMDTEDEQYTAILPPPLDQPGLIFYSAFPSASHGHQSADEAISSQPADADVASIAHDIDDQANQSEANDTVINPQSVQQSQADLNQVATTTAVQANPAIRPTTRVRGHRRPGSNRVTKAQATHIPRPRNSWIIYRQDRTKDLRAQDASLTASEISRIVSTLWRDEMPHVRAYYQQLAQEEAQAHREMYPNYRYRARRPVDRHSRVDTATFWDSLPTLDTDDK